MRGASSRRISFAPATRTRSSIIGFMNESSSKPIRPLELQSHNTTDITSYRHNNNPMKSPLKGTTLASTTPTKCGGIGMNDETEMIAHENKNTSSLQLSPIIYNDFCTPYNMTQLESPCDELNAALIGTDHDNTTYDADMTDVHNERNTLKMDTLFPDNREDIELHSPAVDEGGEREVEQEETDEERMQRELEESEALARQLMAEEAMASYAMSTEYLRENADQFSSEDLAALQAAMAEEDPENDIDEGDDEDDSTSQELSYDALLRLGERIGDVKEERWALVAREKIDQLSTLVWTPSMAEGKEENHTAVKCQVCQFPYEEGDELRELPCEHYFHKECVDSWLETKDTCALCRKSIVPDN